MEKYFYILEMDGTAHLRFTDTINHLQYISSELIQFAGKGNYDFVIYNEEMEEILRVSKIEYSVGVKFITDLQNEKFSANMQEEQAGVQGKVGTVKEKGKVIFYLIFLGFAILSCLYRIKDYAHGGGGINIFNSIITLIFIAILCAGIYMYYIKNKKGRSGTI